MSSSYKLLYRDRRQFVFEEADETHTMAILTLVAGFFAGSIMGVYFASLDATTAGAILFAIVTYITVLTSTFSLKTNPLNVLFMFLTSLGAVLVLIYVSRVVLEYFSDSPFKLVLVFSGLSAVVAELIYLWSRLTWVEDSRMHQLIETIDDSHPLPTDRIRYLASDVGLGSFFRFILEVITFALLRLYFNLKGEKSSAMKYPILIFESMSKWPDAVKEKPIRIVNESLKRVKVCVYHRADYCCWVPVGGLTGGMYELDRGEELVFSPHWPATAFRVKIFAHGVIDFELAAHPCVVRGHKYAFIDVGKPITVLSGGASPPPSMSKQTTHPDWIVNPSSAASSSSSSDEGGNDGRISPPPNRPTSSGGLRRVHSSRANLCQLGARQDSLSDHPQSPSGEAVTTPTTNARRAFRMFVFSEHRASSISILNETTGDIKASFYNIDDTSFVRSLDSFRPTDASGTPAESNVIPRNEWRVFKYCEKSMDSTATSRGGRFCVRAKSGAISQGTSVELGYCTAVLGEALVVRDPIVSSL